MEKIWLSEYPEFVSNVIDTARFQSLNDMLDYSFKKFSSRIAYSNMGHDITYETTDQLSRRFATYLTTELGLTTGDNVAIMMPNLLQYPIATVVNINPLYTAPELLHQLKDSHSKAIVILSHFAQTLQTILSDTDIEHVMITDVADMLPFPKNKIVNFTIKHIKKMIPKWDIPGALPFLTGLKETTHSQSVLPTITRESSAFLQYTGGTTGVSKGAILTHGNLIANILQMKEWLKPVIEDKNNQEKSHVVMTPLPLYHIFSLTVNLLLFNLVGGSLVLITNPRDIVVFVNTLQKHPFSILTGVNTLFNMLLNDPVFQTLDFSQLQLTIGGGMAVQPSVSDHWQKLTGNPIIEGYGLTETSAAVAANPVNATQFSNTIGLPLPGTDVSVRDDTGQEVPLGEEGELWVKGPQVMQGYYQRPDETAKILTADDHWLKTGDIVTMAPNGYIKLIDRKKDMINVSGFNVYPNEIEAVIATHPGVLEVSVIGVEDAHSGEAVKAICSLKDTKDTTVTADTIITYCKDYLTGYKIPKYVEFRDELPKTPVGKILRRHLRDTAMNTVNS
jgi:long-chain acyl-CoA synthetase